MSFCFLYNVVLENYSVQNSPWGGGGSIASSRSIRFLRSARRLILLNICVNFHENISKGFRVTGRTRFCDRQTTNANGTNNMSPSPFGVRHNNI